MAKGGCNKQEYRQAMTGGYGDMIVLLQPLQAAGGLVLFWSLKNPTYPERVIRTRQGVVDLRAEGCLG